jgi:hypothetical protein
MIQAVLQRRRLALSGLDKRVRYQQRLDGLPNNLDAAA